MNVFLKKVDVNLKQFEDRITGDTIILRDQESFRKKIIIITESGHQREYVFFKTKNGGYVLNKSL